jgi:hypothetical protein
MKTAIIPAFSTREKAHVALARLLPRDVERQITDDNEEPLEIPASDNDVIK